MSNNKLNLLLASVVGLLLGAALVLVVGKNSSDGGLVGTAPSGPEIENYVPIIMQDNGYFSRKGIYTTDTLQVDGAVTLNAALSVANSEVTIGSTTQGTIQLDLAAGSDRVCWANSTGANIIVDRADEGYFAGQASSSMKLSMFATTSSSIPASHAYTLVAPTSTSTLISTATFATSTAASTTNSVINAVRTNGVGQLTNVAPNMSICLYRQQGDLVASCTAGTEAGKCESATSTNGMPAVFGIFSYRRL